MRIAAVLGLLVVLAGCTSGSAQEPAETTTAAAPSVLEPCPEPGDEPAAAGTTVPALSFDCLGGGSMDLAAAPGVPTVISLWGSWCPPCREELPLMQQFADAAGDRVQLLGVVSKDGVPQAESFAADAGISFPSAFDRDGELMAAFGLNALPVTMLVAADGTLAHTELGPVESVEELETLVAEHLGVQL